MHGAGGRSVLAGREEMSRKAPAAASGSELPAWITSSAAAPPLLPGLAAWKVFGEGRCWQHGREHQLLGTGCPLLLLRCGTAAPGRSVQPAAPFPSPSLCPAGPTSAGLLQPPEVFPWDSCPRELTPAFPRCWSSISLPSLASPRFHRAVLPASALGTSQNPWSCCPSFDRARGAAAGGQEQGALGGCRGLEGPLSWRGAWGAAPRTCPHLAVCVPSVTCMAPARCTQRHGTASPWGTAQCPKCGVLAKQCLGGSCCCRAAAFVPGGVCRQSSVPRGTRCFPGSAALLAALVSWGCPHAPRAPAASSHTVPKCLWTHRKPQTVDFTT